MGKKVKKKICKGGWFLGYWKGEQIALIPKYNPNHKEEDYTIEEVEVEEEGLIPRIIDPLEMPLSEIREICEENDCPFGWVTGLYLSDHQVSIDEMDLIQKAIDHFVALKSAGTTSMQYRKQFNKMVLEESIAPLSPIAVYKERISQVEQEVLEISAESTNMQMYYMLQSFHKYLEDPNSFEPSHPTGQYRHRKADILTKEESKLFFSALYELDPKYELFARVLWELNSGSDSIVPIEALLRLKKYNMDTNSKVINIYSNSISSTSLWAIVLPEELFLQLEGLAQDTDLFVFRNRSGGHIDSGQVRRKFAKASKLAKLKRRVSPKHLR